MDAFTALALGKIVPKYRTFQCQKCFSVLRDAAKKVSMTERWGIRVERAKGKARASGCERRCCALDDLR